MKIHGHKIEGANEELIAIPRGDDSIIFKARAIPNYDEFDELCPTPEVPKKKMISGRELPNPSDPAHKKALEEHNKRQTAYLIIKSLEATEGLEWETVDLQNPETWLGYEQELRDSGFSEVELGRIVRGVFIANSLDEAKVEEAKERFLSATAAEREEENQ